MYRIKNTKIIYCKECINKWLYKYNNPTTGIKLNEKDIEINYEINNLIEIYIKHKTLDIKNININITINKNIR
jgi:N6-adenosine-specific RNA methylase IME4